MLCSVRYNLVRKPKLCIPQLSDETLSGKLYYKNVYTVINFEFKLKVGENYSDLFNLRPNI